MRGVTISVLAVLLLAQAGAGAAPEAGATLIPAARVAEAFEKGAPLVEGALYKIHASRREAPGLAEIHVRDTDIIYVLDGSAVIVTGGRIVDGRTTAADELRGPEIAGGTSQRLTKGDVFIVPNGMPHQFTEVQAPFLYYVVKATSPAGGRR